MEGALGRAQVQGLGPLLHRPCSTAAQVRVCVNAAGGCSPCSNCTFPKVVPWLSREATPAPPPCAPWCGLVPEAVHGGTLLAAPGTPSLVCMPHGQLRACESDLVPAFFRACFFCGLAGSSSAGAGAGAGAASVPPPLFYGSSSSAPSAPAPAPAASTAMFYGSSTPTGTGAPVSPGNPFVTAAPVGAASPAPAAPVITAADVDLL